MSASIFLVGVLAAMPLTGPVFLQEGVAPPITIIEVPFTTPQDTPIDTAPSANEEPVSTPPDSEPTAGTTIPVRSVQESGVSGSAGLTEGTGAAMVGPIQDDGREARSSEEMLTRQVDVPEESPVPATEPSQMVEAAPLPDTSGPWVLAVVAGAMVGLVSLLGFQTWQALRFYDQDVEIRVPGPRSGAHFIGRFDDQRSDEVIQEREDWVS